MSAADDFPATLEDPCLSSPAGAHGSRGSDEEDSDPLQLNIMGTGGIVREATNEDYGLNGAGDWSSGSDSDEDSTDSDSSDEEDDWEDYERHGTQDTERSTVALVERVKEKDEAAFVQLCREGNPRGVELLEEWLATEDSLRQQLAVMCSSVLDGDRRETSLHIAVSSESLEWLDFVLALVSFESTDSRLKEELSYPDTYGSTPLHYACLKGNPQIIGRLLDTKVDPMATNRSGETILHCAAQTGSRDALQLIVDSELVSIEAVRALMGTADNRGLYPIHIVTATANRGCLELLLTTLTELFDGDGDELQHFLNKVAVDSQKRTVLHMAAYRCDIACSILLIDAGADVHQLDSNKRSVVHWAVTGKMHDNYDSRIRQYIEYLLDEDASVLLKDTCNRSALHYAAFYQHVNTCDFLTSNGIMVMTPDRQGWNALHYAAATGAGALEVLLNVPESGISVVGTKGNKKNMNPLHVAAKLGQEDAFGLLLDYLKPEEQRSLVAVDASKRSVLFYCALKDMEESYTKLLESGANVGLTGVDKRHMNVLHAAAQSGSVELFIAAKRLLADGFEELVCAKDAQGFTVAHHAAAKGGVPVLKWIVASSFDHLLSSTCQEGNSPAFLAANRGELSALQYLMQDAPAFLEGSEFSAEEVLQLRNKRGHSIIHAAVATTSLSGRQIVEYLLTLADECELTDELLHSTDEGGFTPLLTAAEHGFTAGVDYLERAGAVLDAVDNLGLGVVHHAAANGHEGLLEFLIATVKDDATIDLDFERRSKGGTTPMHLAAFSGSVGCCNCLLPLSSLDALDNDGNNIMHYAAASNSSNVVAMLCTKDVGPVYGKNHKGRTPMDTAAFYNSADVIATLGRVDDELCNTVDRDGRTPLMVAAANGSPTAVEALINLGADPDKRDALGRTALHWGAARGYAEAMESLIEAAADACPADNNGMTPLHVAAFHNNKEAIDVLGVDLSEEDLNRADHRGRTPLHVAASAGSEDVIGALIEMTPAIAVLDKKGRTAEAIAAARGHRDIADVLADERVEKEDGEQEGEDTTEQNEEESVDALAEEPSAASSAGEQLSLVDEAGSVQESSSEELVEKHVPDVLDDDHATEGEAETDAEVEGALDQAEGAASPKASVPPLGDFEGKENAEENLVGGEGVAAASVETREDDFGDDMDLEDWADLGSQPDGVREGASSSTVETLPPMAEEPSEGIVGEAGTAKDEKVTDDDGFGDDLDWGEEALDGSEQQQPATTTGALLSLPDGFDEEEDFDSAFADDDGEDSVVEKTALKSGGALLSLPAGFDEEDDFDSAFDEAPPAEASPSKAASQSAVLAQEEGKREGHHLDEGEGFSEEGFGDEDFSWADDEGELSLPSSSATSPPALALSVTKTGAGRGTITLLQPGVSGAGKSPKGEASPLPRMDSDVAAAFAKQALRQLQHKKDSAKRTAAAVDDGFGDGLDEEDLEAAFADAVEQPSLPPAQAAAFSRGSGAVESYGARPSAPAFFGTPQSIELPPIDASFPIAPAEDTTLVRFFRQEKARLLQQVAECQDLLEEMQQYHEAKARSSRKVSDVGSLLPSSPGLRVLLLVLLLWLALFFASRLPFVSFEPVAYPS